MQAPAETPAAPSAVTPAASLERLRRGNEAYLSGPATAVRIDSARRVEVAAGQHPFATILSCADSRVPPEVIFKQGLGDLFVVRVAGAVTDRSVLGSMEYAAEHLHVPLVVVMGHSSCGAVKSAMESKPHAHVEPSEANLDHILSAIRAGLRRAPERGNAWENAVYASVEQNLNDIVEQSPVLAEMGREGKVMFVGAFYDIATGKVVFSEPVAFQSKARQDHSVSSNHATPKEAHR